METKKLKRLAIIRRSENYHSFIKGNKMQSYIIEITIHADSFLVGIDGNRAVSVNDAMILSLNDLAFAVDRASAHIQHAGHMRVYKVSPIDYFGEESSAT
jgi:hypothetical protein